MKLPNGLFLCNLNKHSRFIKFQRRAGRTAMDGRNGFLTVCRLEPKTHAWPGDERSLIQEPTERMCLP